MAFLRLAIFALLWATTTLSLPVDTQRVLASGNAPVACRNIDEFTPEYFLKNTRAKYRKEIHGKALFYTRGASSHAQRLACGSKDYVSIWQIWPEWLYNDRKDDPKNTLRCIHNDPDNVRTFYENMSHAYARMARKHATVLHLSKDYLSPPLDGIWGRIELPTLRDKTDVIEMSKINEDKSKISDWLLPNKGPAAMAEKAITEVRAIFYATKNSWSGVTDSNAGACMLWSSKEGGILDSLW